MHFYLCSQTPNTNHHGINHQFAAGSVVQTIDGKYAIAGYTNSYGAGGNDFWLVKVAQGTLFVVPGSSFGAAGALTVCFIALSTVTICKKGVKVTRQIKQ